MRHHCGAEVYMTARHGLYDVDRYRHHYCANEAPPELERETWDTCNDCGGLWVRFGNGPRLDMLTHEPHACRTEPPSPPPNPRRNGSVEPGPSKPRLSEVGMEIPL